MDEGYIKFRADWVPSKAVENPLVTALLHWRQACYERQWIGAYAPGIGYGNISIRITGSDRFYITGSATGQLPRLNASHIAKVISVDIPDNSLQCDGPIIASSESMSHAVIYRTLPDVQGIIHAHHKGIWERWLHQAPTTDAQAAYGTPAMADSIVALLQHGKAADTGFFVMAGHEDGIFAFGTGLKDAFEVMKQYQLAAT
ncbi:MAG: class II aldolase/adducin family protein [Saprospiraceae bacterium]